MRVHYPRTPHLPWSPGAASDDARAGSTGGLDGREVVVTEKLDGENTTLYPGRAARPVPGLSAPPFPRAGQGTARPDRAADPRRVEGLRRELFARRSLAYAGLDSWFYGFSVRDGGRCLDWDTTVRLLRGLGIPAPPVLRRGTFSERTLRPLRLDPGAQERCAVRAAAGFSRGEVPARVAKWVRPHHVQTDAHWMTRDVVPNGRSPQQFVLRDARSGAGISAAALPHGAGWHAAPHAAGPAVPGRGLAGLHVLAEATARQGPARTGIQRSRLAAEDTGLLTPEPQGPLRDEPCACLAGAPPAVADRCRAEARDSRAGGNAAGADAAARRWQDESFPELLHLTGPDPHGKCTFAAARGVPVADSTDALQSELRANAGPAAWASEGLTGEDRALVLRGAGNTSATATVTQAVFLTGGPLSAPGSRNADRDARAARICRYQLPYPDGAHRTWYAGQDGTAADTDGSLNGDCAPGRRSPLTPFRPAERFRAREPAGARRYYAARPAPGEPPAGR